MSEPTEASSSTSAAKPSPPIETDKSSGSDVSPLTKPPAPSDTVDTCNSYFPPQDDAKTGESSTASTAASAGHETRTRSSETSLSSGGSAVAARILFATGNAPGHVRQYSLPEFSTDGSGQMSRKSSSASVSFRAPRIDLPQGLPRKTGRLLSPSPVRFRQHVAFNNIPVGEPTKSNSLAYTLSISHHGYHPRRRSRTMMVGIDLNAYSDVALQWLLEEYAEDGDEIICVHVVEKDARSVEEKNYKKNAGKMVERIKKMIPDNCAVSIKLEYAVGKLHASFQKLIQVYQPSMLVVGTRGRSMGGIQSLVNTNSFSKYCLQYSPIPTVVVRDYENRKKKKDKRSNDPARHSYAAMLAATNGVHEADCDNNVLYDLEARLSPDEEAHKVAAAIGLPAAFDPTVKPINLDQIFRRSRPSSPSPAVSPSGTTRVPAVKVPDTASPPSVDSDDDESVEDDEAEFGVMTGQRALQAAKESKKQQKKKLHDMEVGEAAALKQIVESDDDDDDDNDEVNGKDTNGAATSTDAAQGSETKA